MSCPSSQAVGQEQRHLPGSLWAPASKRTWNNVISDNLIKHYISVCEDLYPIEARHADCIRHREENLQLEEGSNVPLVLNCYRSTHCNEEGGYESRSAIQQIPEGQGSAAAPWAHLLWEKLSREGVRDRANAKTKWDPIRHDQDHWQVVQVLMVCRQFKIIIEAQEDHVDSNDDGWSLTWWTVKRSFRWRKTPGGRRQGWWEREKPQGRLRGWVRSRRERQFQRRRAWRRGRIGWRRGRERIVERREQKRKGCFPLQQKHPAKLWAPSAQAGAGSRRLEALPTQFLLP